MTTESARSEPHPKNGIKLALAWLAVGVPLIWGVVMTLKKAMALFG
ncbi:MAG TPA: oxalate:formate antiporter [Polyangia bacterium]|nr:oxalate:formate antiporter [Polyangia bacterium]